MKLDRSFVSGQGSGGYTLVRLVINLAQELERNVVAEGVETADQAWRLRRMGCRLAQGFYFAAPMDADQITTLLRNGSVGDASPAIQAVVPAGPAMSAVSDFGQG